MTELRRKRLEWEAFRLEPNTNPLVYGHPEMYGQILLENVLCFFLADSSEIPGSGMILPKAQRETVFDLIRDEWNATFELLLEVKPLLELKLERQFICVLRLFEFHFSLSRRPPSGQTQCVFERR